MKNAHGIDHVGLMLRDLDAAYGDWTRLGFRVSQHQPHSENMGSANRTFVLEDAYVELIGYYGETEFNRPYRAAVREREGLYIVALKTADAAAAATELRALGFDGPAKPNWHSRPATLPDGRKVTVEFDVVHLPRAGARAAVIIICQHHHREHTILPALNDHANGARRLEGVGMLCSDVAAGAEPFARIYGAERLARRDPGTALIRADDAALAFFDRDSLAARYPVEGIGAAVPDTPVVVAFGVSDLARTRKALDAGQVPFVARGDSLLVAPAHASGAVVEFVPAGRWMKS